MYDSVYAFPKIFRIIDLLFLYFYFWNIFHFLDHVSTSHFLLEVLCREFRSFWLTYHVIVFLHLVVENIFDEGSKNMTLLKKIVNV